MLEKAFMMSVNILKESK